MHFPGLHGPPLCVRQEAAVIRIVKASRLAALQAAETELETLRQAHEEYKRVAVKESIDASRTIAAYQRELGIALKDIERRQAVHEDVRRQARHWEEAYNATVDSIGTWVNEVRAKMADPVAGSDFQRDLAVGLWRAFLEKAEEAGDDEFTVRLLKAMLGLDDQTADGSEVKTSPCACPPDTTGECPCPL
jgi:hypothetical protein